VDVASALHDILQRNIESLTFSDIPYGRETFFEEAIAEDFAGWCDKSAIADQIELILRSCEIDAPSAVMDVACGHGKHAEVLHSKGHRVTATDISTTLIDFLTKKHRGEITFLKRSFSEMDFDRAFDLIIVLGNSLSLVPEDVCRGTLGRLANALASNGRLFIELDNPLFFIKNEAGKRCWTKRTDRWLDLSEYHYDPVQKLEKSRDVSIDFCKGTVKEYSFTKRLYTNDEFCRLLDESGLKVTKCFGNWDGTDFSSDSACQLFSVKRDEES
jgi:hypothetical protein